MYMRELLFSMGWGGGGLGTGLRFWKATLGGAWNLGRPRTTFPKRKWPYLDKFTAENALDWSAGILPARSSFLAYLSIY